MVRVLTWEFQPQGRDCQTEKGRSIKKGVINKLICLILFPSPPQGHQTRDHSQTGLQANISLPGQLWGHVESLVDTFFLCSVFCASLQSTLNRDFTVLTDCALGGQLETLMRTSSIKCWDEGAAHYWKWKHGSSRDLCFRTKLSDPLSIFPYFNQW